jgi:hypothetical protein
MRRRTLNKKNGDIAHSFHKKVFNLQVKPVRFKHPPFPLFISINPELLINRISYNESFCKLFFQFICPHGFNLWLDECLSEIEAGAVFNQRQKREIHASRWRRGSESNFGSIGAVRQFRATGSPLH